MLPAHRAQAQRFSFTPEIGYTWPTPIFEHTAAFPGGGGFAASTEHQRLRVHPARVLGARLGFAVMPGWNLYAEGTKSATTDLDYLDRVDATAGVFSETRDFTFASFQTWELGAEKLFHLANRFPEVGVKLGAGSYRFNLNRTTGNPWVSHYNITSAVGGLVIKQSIGRHVAMELEGKGSTGNANTSSFFVDLLPQFDQFEAPKSHRVNTTQLSVGVSLF